MGNWRIYIQALIGVATALGMMALIANTILTGRDAPAGIVSIILSGMGAIFGMNFWPNRTNGNGNDKGKGKRNGNGDGG